MNRIACLILAAACVGTLTVMAQPPGGKGGSPGGPNGQKGSSGQKGASGQQGQGGQHEGPPPSPVIEVLDADGDHEISASEIDNAPVALRTLDRNTDGKLTHDEIHPPGGPSGQGSAAFGGRQGSGGNGGQGGAGGHGGPNGPPTPERFLEHALTFDVNKDGVLSKPELAKMAAAVVEEMRSHGPGGGGPGGGGPGQEINGGQRPKRPTVE